MSTTLNDSWPFGSYGLAELPVTRSEDYAGIKSRSRRMDLAAIVTLVRLALSSKGRLATLFLASLMNVTVAFGLFVIVVAGKERSFTAVYHMVFEPSESAAEREKQIRIAVAQAQLRQEVQNMGMIRQHLESLLVKFPGIARLRVAAIHNGTVGVGDAHVWKYDVIQAVAAIGRIPGPLAQNDPLSGWAHFLPDLLAGKCAFYPTSSIGRTSGRERLEQLGVRQVLTCPIRLPSGELLGAMFTLFDRDEDVPKGDEFIRISTEAAAVAQGLSYALADFNHR